MSSIPYKPRKPTNVDLGPTYYSPTISTRNASMSTHGVSSMNSSVDRFPLQHDHWGLPEPGQYEPMNAFKQVKNQKQILDTSAPFKTTTRDNPVYKVPVTITPDAGEYETDRSAAYKLAQIRNKRRAYQKAKEQSATQQLLQQAAREGKSLSRYLIESDPNYVHPPPLLEKEVLDKRPFQTENNYDKKKKDKRQISVQQLNGLQQKYELNVQKRAEVLAGEIQQEIDQTKAFYDSIGQKLNVVQQIPNNELAALVKQNFQRPLDDGGIAFGTRHAEVPPEGEEILRIQREKEALLAPNLYKTTVKRNRHCLVEIGRQLERSPETQLEVEQSPGAGAYEPRLPEKQSFLVNEAKRFIL